MADHNTIDGMTLLQRLEYFAEWFGKDSDSKVAATLREAAKFVSDSEWKPMDSAPKNGSPMILLSKFNISFVGYFSKGYWMHGGWPVDDKPIGWKEMP